MPPFTRWLGIIGMWSPGSTVWFPGSRAVASSAVVSKVALVYP